VPSDRGVTSGSGAETPDDFFEAYATALASQSWDLVAPLIHQSCTVVFSSGTYVGFDEVETAFRRTFDLIEDEQYVISNLRWLDRAGERAVALYDFAWEGIIAGRPESGGGRGTAVLRREPEGWQLLLEHLGPSAPV